MGIKINEVEHGSKKKFHNYQMQPVLKCKVRENKNIKMGENLKRDLITRVNYKIQRQQHRQGNNKETSNVQEHEEKEKW